MREEGLPGGPGRAGVWLGEPALHLEGMVLPKQKAGSVCGDIQVLSSRFMINLVLWPLVTPRSPLFDGGFFPSRWKRDTQKMLLFFTSPVAPTQM